MRLVLIALIAGLGPAWSQTPSEREERPRLVQLDNGELEIRFRQRSWHVDLSRLVRTNDCEERDCIGRRPTSPCADCQRRSTFLAWDTRHQKVYFGLTTRRSKNNWWIILSYSLITRRTARFTNTWGAAIGPGIVSRSGRYLAYETSYHGGACANSSQLEVVDLWERRVTTARAEGENDITAVVPKAWISPYTFRYEGGTISEADCRKDGGPSEKRLDGSVDVRSLTFR